MRHFSFDKNHFFTRIIIPSTSIQIYSLLKQEFSFDKEEVNRIERNILNRDYNSIYGFYYNGKIRAVSLFKFHQSETGSLDYLIVDKNLREKGIGGSLLDFSLEDIEIDKPHIESISAVTKNPTLKFFEKHGFKKIDDLDDDEYSVMIESTKPFKK